jgi:hypothetical protein
MQQLVGFFRLVSALCARSVDVIRKGPCITQTSRFLHLSESEASQYSSYSMPMLIALPNCVVVRLRPDCSALCARWCFWPVALSGTFDELGPGVILFRAYSLGVSPPIHCPRLFLLTLFSVIIRVEMRDIFPKSPVSRPYNRMKCF